jgi:LSD1 subclass zinc finger protein
MIAQSLLDILVCPACKQPLTLQDNGTTLKCGACHRAYPVHDDIPILLIDEARIEPA